ncbi:hypothetical protein LJC04_01525 [Ruminococcaceae bacterium OttesenSCG-928-O06]|nr:hypothetical protein [Ruminococcaceae bacterium OttesenSCG-928-O06]
MADKEKKDKMVDFPEYDPDRRVPFPPPADAKSPFGTPNTRKEAEAPKGPPYHQTYDPDPVTPDPSQTTPGAVDIRDPNARLPEDADLSKYSPDVELKK